MFEKKINILSWIIYFFFVFDIKFLVIMFGNMMKFIVILKSLCIIYGIYSKLRLLVMSFF